MATRQVFQRGDLRLGDDEFENGFKALANKQEITEYGRLVMRLLGDKIERDKGRKETAKSDLETTSQDRKFLPSLRRIVDVVDTVLEWLEHSGKDGLMSLKKQETVLRGMFHLTDLANQASVFAALEMTSSFLDGPSDAFRSKRDFIRNCLGDIEEHVERIQQLVEEASKSLKAIIDDAGVDKRKGIQFDNIVREAHVEIRACHRLLHSANEKINELSTKMNTRKWFSRFFRLAGWGVTCSWLYQRYRGSNHFVPLWFGGSALTGMMWLSLYPISTYEFHESLLELDSQHNTLSQKLDILSEKLRSTKDYKDGLDGINVSTV